MGNYPQKAREECDREDERWLHSLAEGELAALEPLYVRYRGLVMSVLRRHASTSSADLEDQCQEVFLALRDAARHYAGTASVRAFIAGVATRKAWKLRATAALRRSALGRLFAGRSEPVEQPMAAADARHDAAWLLQQLPEAQRAVLVLHQVEHLSAEEIASALGISVNTVWTRLHRARARLRELDPP